MMRLMQRNLGSKKSLLFGMMNDKKNKNWGVRKVTLSLLL